MKMNVTIVTDRKIIKAKGTCSACGRVAQVYFIDCWPKEIIQCGCGKTMVVKGFKNIPSPKPAN